MTTKNSFFFSSSSKKKEYEKDLPCRQTLFENDFSEYVTKIKSESERETIQENSKILLTKYAQVNLLLLCISTYSYVPRKNQFFCSKYSSRAKFSFFDLIELNREKRKKNLIK